MRVIPNNYIEADVKFASLPLGMAKMLDEEGKPSSPIDFIERTNGVLIYNADKSRFMMPFEMSFEDGDYEGIIEGISNPDLKALFDGVQPILVKNDLENTDAHTVRILNYSKKVELMKVNENWNKESELQ